MVNKRTAYLAMLILACMAVFSPRVFADDLDDRLAAAKKQGTPVLLEFGAEWCIPCQQMKPAMRKIEKRYRGKLSIITIDMDRSREEASRYHIRVIPTLVFLDKSGHEIKRLLGESSYEEIVAVLLSEGL